MKKTYSTCLAEVLTLSSEDVLTLSVSDNAFDLDDGDGGIGGDLSDYYS